MLSCWVNGGTGVCRRRPSGRRETAPTSRSAHLRQWGTDENHIDQDELFDGHVNNINPACFHVGLMAAQGRVAVGHQADARQHHTSRSTHLRQCGADDNQIDQDELFDRHVNSMDPDADKPLPLAVVLLVSPW
ncbi:hypothetical protein [Halomonas cupida]|uniref:hypothetical protein n=1 Tax=Halomonas cupida TaxID=44933 RepID=UPI003A933887